MSQKKKTIEELLDEALISKEQQPYEVPKNWIWIKFGRVAKLYNGYAFKSTDYHEEGIPVIRISDISGESTSPQKSVRVPFDLYNERFLVKKGDLLIAMSGATTGKTGVYNSDEIALQNQRVGNIKVVNQQVLDPVFKNYFVFNNSKEILKIAYGGAQPNISGALIEELSFPLPPLDEQKRIAEKVEQLLSKVEEAKQLIEEAKETFKMRRAAILDKAFRGELTDGTDGLNKVEGQPYSIPNNWDWKSFNEVAKICSNLVDPKLHKDFPHIAPDNIEKGTGQLLGYQTIEESKVKSPKHYFFKGQILYSKIRPYLSKVTLAKFDGLCSADMYPIETNLDTKYLYWYMLSVFFVEKASTAGSRSVLPKINQKELGNIPVPVPPIETQRRIVRIIEKTLSQEKQTIRYVEDTIVNMERLKQSVLYRAFRGELGTNDLSEESAIELLKKVLQEQVK
ncbi:restriction endonuclease subunit S [Bacillus circulans]|uniref:restriction endonuclease subunit S n=1 Tax=Niallia circulans TaxID=1397 RepID=UPI00155FB220|nr:restriction endonuclease subunit S [Niallia circulans]NRG27409.1 restriction endonuclease subunit S [Niallia circulans]